jgi:hypothetical protein
MCRRLVRQQVGDAEDNWRAVLFALKTGYEMLSTIQDFATSRIAKRRQQ